MKKYITKEEINNEREEVIDELYELDLDTHLNLYKNEPNGRKRTAELLLKLNWLEEILEKY